MAWSSFPSLSSIASNEHDVFLSFRGEDTRYNITSHLLAGLKRWNIKTYMDQDLPKGDEISKKVHRAIQGSKVAIVIFTENYATSSWCLDELVKIIECKETHGLCFLPIFYHVDPSDVRYQNGSYAEALAEHERRCGHNKEKLDSWKQALTKAANHSGYHTLEYRKEDELVEKIAQDVSMRVQSSDLQRGVKISDKLRKATEGSELAIVIFSKNYADSSWCLDELVKIIECKEKNGQILLPIFYHIDSSVVRYQKGSYAKALKHKLHKAFVHCGKFPRYNKEKLNSWREALTKAANHSGLHISEHREEAELVEKIDEDVSLRLQSKQLDEDMSPPVWKRSFEKTMRVIKQNTDVQLDLKFMKEKHP